MRNKVLRKSQNIAMRKPRQIMFKVENVYWHDKEQGLYAKDGNIFMLYWQEHTGLNSKNKVWNCYGIVNRDDLKLKLGRKQWNKFMSQNKKVFILQVNGEV